jgi:hypothetical protein
MNVLPPAFLDGKSYVPSEEEMENCLWLQTDLSRKSNKCPRPANCAICDHHPQNRSRLRRERIASHGGK